jgi:transcriptional regulator with XRE-family HTH domain
MTEHPLRVWRKDNKITQEAVAAAIGLHASHISQLENWQKGISLEKAAALEQFTGGAIRVSDLVRESGQ